LSNAIKYNRQGGSVTLSCDVVSDYVRIAVADTGAGIPDERRQEMFQPFHRLGAERTHIEGTGIGLVLCKRLVEAMDGRIGFESTVNVGSRFWFELPSAVSVRESYPLNTSLKETSSVFSLAEKKTASSETGFDEKLI
jgi:signal transduction histidine kinase